MKAIIIGLVLLAVSALNVALPDVGTLLDTWRIWFSLVAFVFGWICFIRGITEVVE